MGCYFLMYKSIIIHKKGGDMEAFVTALTASITSASLWSALAPVVPIVVVGVLFSLGLHFTRRATNGISKGKGRI